MSLFKKIVYTLYFNSSPSRRRQTRISIKSRKDKRLSQKFFKNITQLKVSNHTLQIIKLNNQLFKFRKSPSKLLHQWSKKLREKPNRALLLAAAELSYAIAESKSGKVTFLYLSSAYYSFSFLFDTGLEEINYYSPNFRLARELYNHSLANLITSEDSNIIGLNYPAQVQTLNGTLNLTSFSNEFPWDPKKFNKFLPAYDFVVKGFLVDSKEYGIGTPLIAVKNFEPDIQLNNEKRNHFLFPTEQAYPVTAILHFKDSIYDETTNKTTFNASLKLINPLKTNHVTINNSRTPLEIDITSPLAYFLNGKPYKKNMTRLLEPEDHFSPFSHGIHMLIPYQEDKIPVILVHGLLSTVRTWEEMVNTLLRNPKIRSRYQFWAFSYSTGNPILYSAHNLRQNLTEVWKTFEPDLNNKFFNKAVIIGHSMGGLLAKTMLLNVEDKIYNSVSETNLDELNLSADNYKTIKNMLFFNRLPFIKKCIFLSTPHKGSAKANNPFPRFSSSVIKLSDGLLDMFTNFHNSHKKLNAEKTLKIKTLTTGIDSLLPENPTLKVLNSVPIPDEVECHSIFGNIKQADTPNGTDSIVSYDSTHLESAVSEKIIHCNHATHRHPDTILEVERILLDYLKKN